MNWFWIFFLAGGLVITEILALIFVYEFSRTSLIQYFMLGVLFYALVCWLLARSFRLGTVSLIFALASSLTLISILLVGRFYYHEKWSTKEWLAMGFLIGAIVLLYLNNGHRKKISDWVG